jgi:hypothetical protein
MANKTMKTRIIHKHAIATHWALATNFVPKQGELIVYDDRYIDSDGNEVIVADAVKYKIGDGVTLVNDLPFVGGSLVKSDIISLAASKWIKGTNVYSQVVSIPNVTTNSKVDIYPTPEQLIELQSAGIALMAVNDNGTVTVYALNNKPTSNYSMQVTLTELNAEV